MAEKTLWERIAYALLCVIAPVAWGLLVLRVSNRIEARVRESGRGRPGEEARAEMPPLDYHI